VNLTGWRFLLFALAGAGAIVLLANLGVPGTGEERIDRHTGKRVLVVRNVADAIAEARSTGHVREALDAIRKRLEQFPDEAVLRRYAAVFEAELAGALDEPPPAHPEAAVLAAEQSRARRRLEALRASPGKKLLHEPLLAVLRDLEADSAVGAATEGFFAPLARWRPEHAQGPWRPDEMAVRRLDELEDRAARDPAPYLEIASAYRSQGRVRARMRWLLRAYGAFPRSVEVRERLVAAYLEQGRVLETFVVTGSALVDHPTDLELWRLRARLAGWLSRPRAEIEAREVLLEEEDAPKARERLITLYRASGRPEAAVPHALKLAEGSTDKQVLERPARLALEGGDVDRALEILEHNAERTGEPTYWREKIVAYAWQDLRVERVVSELSWLRRRFPEKDYEQRLEGVLRRTNRTAQLAALLDERLLRNPDDEALETELLGLHAVLGNEKRVRQIMLGRIVRLEEPREFFSQIATFRGMRLEGVDELVPQMARLPQLKAEDVGYVLDQLRPYLDEPRYREAAEIVAHRYPREPEAVELLILLADMTDTDQARAEALRDLVRRYPDHPELLRAWIERASWAGATEAELEARETWLRGNPDDLDNRRKLAELYGALNRPGDALVHWRVLARKEGPGSEAALFLIDTLFAAERLEEAMEWLEKRAMLPSSTVDDRLHVADQLFANERFDRALRFYAAVLDTHPDDAHALMRSGQIRSWTNDPRGAIPFLERRLQVSEENAAEVRYYLGEAHWSIRDDAAGRRYHERALEELLALEGRDIEQDVMVAKMLARFGRVEEARPIFERILEQRPKSVDLILDYADSMVAIEDAAKARELVDRAKALQPKRARTMRLDGKVMILERRYVEAVAVLTETTRLHGADAGTESELGRARELLGEWRGAAESYRRSLALQPLNRDVAHALQRVADQAAAIVHAQLLYRKTAQDTLAELRGRGSILLEDEHTRLAAGLGFARYSGRAAVIDGGATDVTESVTLLELAGFRRFEALHRISAGIEIFPGASGDAPVGGWLGIHMANAEPFRSVDVKVFGNLLLESPAAAVGLGGRRSGVRVSGFTDVGERYWAALDLGYEILGIDLPGGGTEQDGRFRGAISFGWRVLEGNRAVADELRIDRAMLPGLAGALVAGEPSESARTQLTVWVTYEGVRLLDGAELATLIPVGESFDYLLLGARADMHVAPGLGAKLEGYAGTDLGESGLLFGIEGGVTWRPVHRTEFTFAAGYGQDLGRGDEEDSLFVRAAFAYRW